MTDQELHAYAESWLRWCRTRKYYIALAAPSILARLQPQKLGEPPDAELSAELQWFNMAVHTLADMRDEDYECFKKYYIERAKNIKEVAHKLGIGTRTFYDRRLRFVRKAISMGVSLKRVQCGMRTPKDEAVVD